VTLRPRAGGAPWIACVVLAGALAGAGAGSLRVDAIDAGALRGPAGAEVRLSGRVASVPRRDPGGVSAEFEAGEGRVLLSAPSLEGLEVGDGVAAEGRLAEPPPWRAATLRRRGIAAVLEAERVQPTNERRGGLAGRIDVIRGRAEVALGKAMPEREAALARGFVLGQDDAIDVRTREDFRRSGLAHLLAVSGQNVILLCLLAWPFLALAGLSLRARLGVLLVLIAVYVPVTGAGASIQRAGVMGAAGLVAALAGRPSSRSYALLLAAVVTLALNPRACGDVGWQLSFAAVVGIFLWTGRLASMLDGGAGPGTPRRALAEGAAMTISATVATAPLMAHHFGSLSPVALPANLLALPAVAPAMWLGMLTSMAGQLPGLPVAPINWLDSLCLAYIAQVARWFGAPDWALLEFELAGALEVIAAFVLLALGVELGLAVARRRRELRGPRAGGQPKRSLRVRVAAGFAGLALAGLLLASLIEGGPGPAAAGRLRVTALDVGQGDAILLEPPGSDPVLVDAGPPGSGAATDLRGLGVGRLAALLVTHADSDHAGGAAEVLSSVPVERLGLGRPAPALSAAATEAGSTPLVLAEGGELRSGELRLSVLWPPRQGGFEAGGSSTDAEGEENASSLVLLAEWRHFSMLLTGDAEAEATHLEPGPVDVLKVAHHGSADAGLERLLDLAAPKLAVISVGDNPYGHPASETLGELADAEVPVARTDDGPVAIEADTGGWWLSGG
jgi:competence protein ComEC